MLLYSNSAPGAKCGGRLKARRSSSSDGPDLARVVVEALRPVPARRCNCRGRCASSAARRMVMLSPFGTPRHTSRSGRRSRSLPSWASCTITAAVIVLVFEATRKCVSAAGGVARQTRSCRSPDEIALRRPQQNHRPRQHQLLGRGLDNLAERCGIDGFEIRLSRRAAADEADHRKHNCRQPNRHEQLSLERE